MEIHFKSKCLIAVTLELKEEVGACSSFDATLLTGWVLHLRPSGCRPPANIVCSAAALIVPCSLSSLAEGRGVQTGQVACNFAERTASR